LTITAIINQQLTIKEPVETVISRVLFPCAIQGGDHSSGMSIARHLTQPTRELRAGHSQALLYLVLLRVGFTKPATSPPQLVSSYLTFSPLPGKGPAVYFLWHFPWGRPRSALRTTLPCGARTFLQAKILPGDHRPSPPAKNIL